MRKKYLAVPLALAAMGVAACGSSSVKYPVNVQTNYLNSCEAIGGKATPKACGCTLSYIEARVPLGQFQTSENALTSGGDIPKWMYAAIRACA